MKHFIEKLEDLIDNVEIEGLHKLYNDLEEAIHARTEELESLFILDNKISDLIEKRDEELLYELWDAVGELIDECDGTLIKLQAGHEYVGCLILNRIEELEDV